MGPRCRASRAPWAGPARPDPGALQHTALHGARSIREERLALIVARRVRVGPIERARQAAARRNVDIEWIAADLAIYEPEESAFDLVLIAYLQLRADDLRAALTRAVSAVAPGGELLLIGHARPNLQGGYGGPRNPAVLWVREQMQEMLRALGMNVERSDYVGRPVETPEGPREAIDLVVRARRPSVEDADEPLTLVE